MKKTLKYLTTIFVAMAAASAMAQTTMPAPENPATGIWIQQVGDIVPHAATKATLYYTKFRENDRVKSISYQYDGAGYLLMKPSDKKTLCGVSDGVQGADGIAHHPDGDLLIAGQGTPIYKVSKTAKDSNQACLAQTSYPKQSTSGFWHLMMDPSGDKLWAAGIPGYLFRFSTSKDSSSQNFDALGYQVELRPNTANRRKDYKLTTVVWDGEGTAFFTYSDHLGGGCEKYEGTKSSGDYAACTDEERKAKSASAYFGVFTDTTKVKVTAENQSKYGGKVGDSVIASVGTKILIDSLEGAHGAAYDEYSKTIFLFGGAKIVQIKTYREGGEVKAKKLASIDLREYFFLETKANMPEPRTWDGNEYSGSVGWRLDQGTTDGYGHIFVASNTGHMVFVDFSSNVNKRIDNDVLVHVQWIDNYLDDLAPLSGVGVVRHNANTGGEDEFSSSSQSSSSLIEYNESSSSATGGSSGSNTGSSGSTGSSNSNGSSGSTGGSSGSTESSNSNGDNGSSGSTGGSSGSTGSSNSNGDNGSSGSTGGSSGSNEGSGNSSSDGSNNGGSSGSDGNNNGGSSSSNGSGNGEDVSHGSSSSRATGSGDDIVGRSSSSRVYYGAEDYEIDNGSDLDAYPTAESFDLGDSIVGNTVILEPTEASSTNPGVVVVNDNPYMLSADPKGIAMDLSYDSDISWAKVGDIVAITLDKDKVKEIFGSIDSMTIVSITDVEVVNPTTGEKTKQLTIDAEGNVTIFVTADQVVQGGSIKVFGDGKMVIIDNINFYDPIPDSRIGYIKDTSDDGHFDYVEILLKEELSENYYLDGVKLVVGTDTVECINPTIKGDRIVAGVEDFRLPGVGEFPSDAKAIITYGDKAGSGATYLRESPVVEIGSNIIEAAYAIRNANGMDSLFIRFNIDLYPVDVSSPDMLVMLKQEAARYGLDDIQKVYMPTKNIIILVSKTFNLKGSGKDSVSLYPQVTFESLPYITSDEYDREVSVKVTDRFPSAKNVEYWDTDGDGVLDQIVTVFDKKLTAADIDGSLFMTFPWYSSRGLVVQLQAQAADLKIDPNDSTRVIWDVVSTMRLAEGVTSISDALPEATIYTYYKIFGETFVGEETAPLVDKMSPVVTYATLSYGKKADTLVVTFSEPIQELQGKDYFSYIHGGVTSVLNPTRIDLSSDGLTAKLVLNGNDGTILPGDSLVVRRGDDDAIRDVYGNVAGEKPQAVVINGLMNQFVESTTMGSFDASDDRIVDEDSNKTYTLQTVSSVNLRYVPSSTTAEDLEKEGALGHLVELGERFVPQLLDRAQYSADGTFDSSVLDSIKPEDVYISFIVNYFDHLGQYVNDTVITVPCSSPKFGGNCLEADKKVFVNWNFKDHKGRFVGTGVYNVQFKMIVRYENKKIEEEMKDKWGVRRRKGKK